MKMLRFRNRRSCNPFCILKYVRYRAFITFLSILIVISVILVYRGTLVLYSSAYNLRSSILRMEGGEVLLKNDGEETNAACRLPALDPFHPGVVQFMKDLGDLRCEGVSYSSFDNNVLRVEGEGIVSAQYRRIKRSPGNDFDVVLSDPVSIQSTNARPAAAENQKGEPLSDNSWLNFLGELGERVC